MHILVEERQRKSKLQLPKLVHVEYIEQEVSFFALCTPRGVNTSATAVGAGSPARLVHWGTWLRRGKSGLCSRAIACRVHSTFILIHTLCIAPYCDSLRGAWCVI